MNYIDDAELRKELVKWRRSGKRPEDRTPSERLGELLLLLHDRMLGHFKFRGYPQEVKEDMRSYSLLRVFKRGLATYKFSGSPFSYFTRGVYMNYVTFLRKRYRDECKDRLVEDELKARSLEGLPARPWKESNQAL